MRLGEWRKTAPNRECMSNAVVAALKPVLVDLGAEADPECWVNWGEDPDIRYSVFTPTRGGLISTAIRVNTPEEGPRVTGKLIRWSRLQLSELSIESAGGHRLVAVQVEGQVLKGQDEAADHICEFVRGLIASVDGRDLQVSVEAGSFVPQAVAAPRAASRTATAKAGAGASSKTAPTAPPARLAAPSADAAPRGVPAAPQAAPVSLVPSAPKVATPAADPAARRAARRLTAQKPAASTALVPVPGSRPTRPAPVAEPAGSEPARVAPHPIFAPGSAPAARRPDEAPTDRVEETGEQTDREPRRPKTWAP